jgi:hypothetical protein
VSNSYKEGGGGGEGTYSDPLSNAEECFLVEEEVLESSERTLGVHGSALEKDITVALEVVARSTRSETEAT